jgi:(p)ppGpp synthase/HD superfamily hydrolase
MSGPTIEQTIALVEKLFDGVTDKGGKPYAGHCIRVMNYLPDTATEDERHAALLHDVIEDTEWTSLDLMCCGYSVRTVELVKALSRPDGSTYMDWIRQIAASGDAGLIAIKLADNADNSDPGRIAQLPPDQRDIASRYERARKILLGANQRTDAKETSPPK